MYALSPATHLYRSAKVLHSISTKKPTFVTVGPHTLLRMITFSFNDMSFVVPLRCVFSLNIINNITWFVDAQTILYSHSWRVRTLHVHCQWRTEYGNVGLSVQFHMLILWCKGFSACVGAIAFYIPSNRTLKHNLT